MAVSNVCLADKWFASNAEAFVLGRGQIHHSQRVCRVLINGQQRINQFDREICAPVFEMRGFNEYPETMNIGLEIYSLCDSNAQGHYPFISMPNALKKQRFSSSDSASKTLHRWCTYKLKKWQLFATITFYVDNDKHASHALLPIDTQTTGFSWLNQSQAEWKFEKNKHDKDQHQKWCKNKMMSCEGKKSQF